MNKLFKTISLSLITVLAAGLMMVPSTQANESALNVEFENDPLFLNTDLKPGDSVTRWVKVTNNSDETKPVATEAINYPNPVPSDDLSRALNINIKKGSTDLYSASLYDFYLAEETFLSNINSGETIQYDFVVSFPADKGNEWQNTTTYFDILIGFQGGEIPPGPPSPPGPTPYINGGGVPLVPGLTILDGSVKVTLDCFCNAAITWTTNYASTSQVIYGTGTEAHILDLTDTSGTPAKYGYAHTSPEYNSDPKVINHLVNLNGLTPDTTYYFRAVSRDDSAPSISREFNFTTGSCQCLFEEPEEPTNGKEVVIGPGTSAGPGEPSEEERIVLPGEVLAAGEEIEPETFSNFLANLLGDIANALKDFLGGCHACLPWWFILILAAYPLMKFLACRQQKEDKNVLIPSKKPDRKAEITWLGWLVFLVGLAIYFYLTKRFCVEIWVFLLLSLITLLLRYYFLKGPEEKKINIRLFLGTAIIIILFIIWLIYTCLPFWLILLALVIFFFGADFFKGESEKKKTSPTPTDFSSTPTTPAPPTTPPLT